MKKAAKEALPDKIYVPTKARGVSDRTAELFRKRSKVKASANGKMPSQLDEIQKEIKSSCLQDFVDWVNDNVKAMEAANAVGDTRKIFSIVNYLSKKGK